MSRRIYLDGTSANTFPFLFGTPFIFRKVEPGEEVDEEEGEYIEQPDGEEEDELVDDEEEPSNDGGVLVGDQQEIGSTSEQTARKKMPRQSKYVNGRRKKTAEAADKIDEEEDNDDADDEEDPLKEATMNDAEHYDYDDSGGGLGGFSFIPPSGFDKPYTKADLERIRVDPNYEWLLKDLNLTNEKRVIDVTDIIEKHEGLMNKSANEHDQTNDLLNKVSLDTTKDQAATARVENEDIDEEDEEDEASQADERDDEEDEGEEEEQAEHDEEEEEDDHRQDRSYISKLYEKLVKPGENNESVNESKTYYPEEEVNTTADQDYSTHSSTTGTGTYADWSKNFRTNGHHKPNQQPQHQPQPQQPKHSDEDQEVHKINNTATKNNHNKFSKSFEVLDTLIDRVDNGIKLKRANRNNGETDQNHPDVQSKNTKKYSQRKATSNLTINGSSHYNGHNGTNEHGDDGANESSKVVVESLKKEWSSMLNKLEHDYKTKLDEQQRLNDAKLKSFQDEIKKCIYEQQEKIMESQAAAAAKQRYEEKAYTPDITRHTTPAPQQQVELVDACTSPVANSPTPMSANITAAPVTNTTTTSIVDNAKYISNLRIELKAKHARHVQDLKDYYEKELDEHKAQLNAYKLRYGIMNPNLSTASEPDEDYKQLSEEYKLKYEQLVDNFNELKNTNEALLNKIKEDNDHLKYLTHENYELRNKVNTLESTLGNLNEKLSNLQDTSAQFESQLTESIKQQDKYMRELQLEKRTLLKKVQECDDLRLSMKFYEQKCDGYELKLDERDNIIARLKTKLVQMENDMTRLDYEYQKLRTSYNSKSSNAYQQPYIAGSNGGNVAESKDDYRNSSQQSQSQMKHHFGPPLQLPIRNQSKYQSNPNLSMNGNSHQHLNQSQMQTTSPNKTHVNIFCNNSNSNNNSSSSSPSSKSPRSRSPPPPSASASGPQASTSQQQPITVPISSPVNHKINFIRVNKSPNSELNINTSTNNNNNNNIKSSINSSSTSSYNYQQQQQPRENQSLHFQVNHPPSTPNQTADQDDITASTFGSSNSPYNNNNNYYNNKIYSSTNNNNNNANNNQHQQQHSPPSATPNSQPSTPLNGCVNGVCSINGNYNSNQNNNNNGSATASTNNSNNKFLNLTPDRQLKYIEQLESEFDLLMKLRGQLEAKLTRLPYKTTNHNMHAIRESVESELNLVEKKLASVKLELRKLNIIKSH